MEGRDQQNAYKCRRTWGGSPLEELLWVPYSLCACLPNRLRQRAQVWGVGGARPAFKSSASDWSPSLSPLTGVTPMLCHSGLCDAVDIAGIHIEVKVAAYIHYRVSKGRCAQPLHRKELRKPRYCDPSCVITRMRSLFSGPQRRWLSVLIMFEEVEGRSGVSQAGTESAIWHLYPDIDWVCVQLWTGGSYRLPSREHPSLQGKN